MKRDIKVEKLIVHAENFIWNLHLDTDKFGTSAPPYVEVAHILNSTQSVTTLHCMESISGEQTCWNASALRLKHLLLYLVPDWSNDRISLSTNLNADFMAILKLG